jgi:hypothetical protein
MKMKQQLTPPPHMSDAAKTAFDKALSEGDLVYAEALCSPRARMPSVEEAHAQALSNSLQQCGDVVVVSDTNHCAAATALNEVELVAGA